MTRAAVTLVAWMFVLSGCEDFALWTLPTMGPRWGISPCSTAKGEVDSGVTMSLARAFRSSPNTITAHVLLANYTQDSVVTPLEVNGSLFGMAKSNNRSHIIGELKALGGGLFRDYGKQLLRNGSGSFGCTLPPL